MEFTGERFLPECQREIWYEHFHRYVFARHLARNRRVLDLACGEGYGASLLSDVARQVIAVDRSGEAVVHARGEYGNDRLVLVQGDASAIPLADASVDLVVSFETLEHLEAQTEMVGEFARVLRKDGLVLISSPDKRTYSDERDYTNEFHVRELYLEEFKALLAEHFPAVRLFGQKLGFHSVIWDPESAHGGKVTAEAVARDDAEPGPWQPSPMYWIGVCAAAPGALERAGLTDLALFADTEESVYAHYEHEIRKNMAAGGIIAERDQRIAELEARLADRDHNMPGWLQRLTRKILK
ncbi:MAG: class I SAM-dependent methyltransferase [Xanthomonadales bacterium]|nr:class I SAM-dependent methyltransferase [Xanthomonadales bacterium]